MREWSTLGALAGQSWAPVDTGAPFGFGINTYSLLLADQAASGTRARRFQATARSIHPIELRVVRVGCHYELREVTL